MPSKSSIILWCDKCENKDVNSVGGNCKMVEQEKSKCFAEKALLLHFVHCVEVLWVDMTPRTAKVCVRRLCGPFWRICEAFKIQTFIIARYLPGSSRKPMVYSPWNTFCCLKKQTNKQKQYMRPGSFILLKPLRVDLIF